MRRLWQLLISLILLVSLVSLISLEVLAGPSHAQPESPRSLEELLEQVRAEHRADSKLHADREARFRAERDQQKALVQKAETELARAKQASGQLRTTFEENETRLAERRSQLNERAASLGELFGVVRQAARDAASVIEDSVISAQHAGRADFLTSLAESTELASLEELEQLWVVLLEEMTQSGQVVTFPTAVVGADGAPQQQAVTRVGVFNAVSGGKYLRYIPETHQLVELARQPEQQYQTWAQELEHTTDGYTAFGLDPSRGAILAALVQSPDGWERFEQGGIIGYIIVVLGLLAVLLIIERAVYLGLEGRRMHVQRNADAPLANNALGRVMQVYQEDTVQDVETLEARLDEAILKQIPKLERGLSTISILAAVAPLLGLLGTVVGMIDTFQSITLFGSGDPRIMSSGISQALVTTQLGLCVAIPLVLCHTLLSNKSNRLIQILDEQSAGLIAKLAEQRHERTRTAD